ncbi:MAG TPA: hypothetical protein VFO96_06665 [Gemmatimonadales bacterium]|nr:hypothetical protein [Gemmatimonadales bacterium]
MTYGPSHPANVSGITIDAVHVQEEFRANAARTPPQTVGSWHPDRVANLTTLLARPELRPLADGIAFGLHAQEPVPWMLRDGLVSLHGSVADRADAAAAVVLRHALEVALLDRLLPNDDDARMAGLGLACHATYGYLDGLTAGEREQVVGLDPSWRQMLVAPCVDDAPRLLDHLREHAATLFLLRAWDALAAVARFSDAALQQRVLGRLTALLPLALPTERLLTLGGDSRLPIDPATGLNRYGCSPKPRPRAHTFSSCTATSVSEIGFRAAERSRQRLIAAVSQDGFEEAILDHSESIRRAILRWLHLDQPGTELVLTSSGTDAELLALYFASGSSDAPVTSVVLAPTEVGSGTVPAAGGRHFDSLTPHGRPAEPGAPVRGLPTDRLELVQIPVRQADGAVVAAQELDAVIEATVQDRCERGGTVLLHLVDASKTGVGGPSVELARALLERYPEQLTVLVDAAQMRLSRPALRHYLNCGFLLLITGSKFFTGPPFSGGLVVPPGTASRVDHLPPLPLGLADYTSRSDFPLRWRGLTHGIPLGANVGSLLRWRAALWEMEAFYVVPADRQFAAVRHFVEGLDRAVATSEWVKMVEAPALTRLPEGDEQAWDSTQTIFSLLVKRRHAPAGEPPYLVLDEVKQLYLWLNRDVSALLPDGIDDDERHVAAASCHVGQPVVIFSDHGHQYAAIRIAFGARLVSRVEMDPLLGDTAAARREGELASALAVLRKIELIARCWGEMRG